MLAGSLRVKAQVWRRIQVGTTEYNEPTWSEQLWRETFAEMRSRRGQEHHTGSQIIALTQWYFKFRYHSVAGIDPTMWLVVNGQRYDIRNIVPDFARKREIEVEARVANINMEDGSSGGVFALSIRIPSNMPVGTTGVAYTGVAPDASGGASPYVFSLVGALPAGLTLNASTGVVSGTPSAAGSTTFGIKVTDANGDTATAPGIPITINTPPEP